MMEHVNAAFEDRRVAAYLAMGGEVRITKDTQGLANKGTDGWDGIRPVEDGLRGTLVAVRITHEGAYYDGRGKTKRRTNPKLEFAIRFTDELASWWVAENVVDL